MMKPTLSLLLALYALIFYLALTSPKIYLPMLFWAGVFLTGALLGGLGIYAGKRENLRQTWQSKREKPLGFVLNPNRRPQELLTFASDYPEVLQNPAIELLSLEDPNFLEQLYAVMKDAENKRREQERKLEEEVSPIFLGGALLPAFIVIAVIFARWYASGTSYV